VNSGRRDKLRPLEADAGACQLINALPAHIAEFGLVAETETEGLAQLGAMIITDEINHEALPSAMKHALQAIVDQLAFAAWIGVVPRQHSTGGKERIGGISKQGDRYLRRLLVIGATAVVRQARLHPQKHPFIMRLLAKEPAKLVAVAVANKMARIPWAIMVKGGHYRAPELAAAA
jgi:transposase